MDLGTYQTDQAKRSTDGALESVGQMVRETYRWLLVPSEEMQRGKMILRWEAVGVSPSAPNLVEEIENKLKEEGWVISAWSPVFLNRELNQWYFKEGVDHVSALKVWQDTCHYVYLPRLAHAKVFESTIAAGCATKDGFAFASAVDGDRYLGFCFGRSALVTMDDASVLISHDAAIRYQEKLDAEAAEKEAARQKSGETPGDGTTATGRQRQLRKSSPLPDVPGVPTAPTQFFGTVELDAVSATMDFSTVVNEVIQHFSSQSGIDVTVTVEIQARASAGFDVGTQRTVKENCGVLKFKSAQFEV
jgi:hypothetical protein